MRDLRSLSWAYLCDVEIGPLATWLAEGGADWPPVKGGQPNRVQAPPEALPAIHEVLSWFGGVVTYDEYRACISRLIPGRTYEYHRDPQPPEWITRMHVPIVTNPDAWFMWEPEDGVRVHFAAGKAYAFNTLIPHNFGNDGAADRIHLTFDVLRG